MTDYRMEIVILGLSITSSWGNGHATTYRSLMKELIRAGHRVLFLERDMPWYAANRDMPNPPYGRTELYSSLEELKDRFDSSIRHADMVIVGSYVPDGIAVGEWVTQLAQGIKAFYDIDTPVTLANLAQQDYEYLTPALIPKYDLYLSFTGGPTLRRIENDWGSPMARSLYCSFDPELYFPEARALRYDLGYMGTYSEDRQPMLDNLLLKPARKWVGGSFIVAGSQFPSYIQWPHNVDRIEHLPPAEHRSFYNLQRYTLNVTRADRVKSGYSPSVRLFEAAACSTPIISDYWDGLDEFFTPGKEILISQSPKETLDYLQKVPEHERLLIGAHARRRVLSEHTAAHRASELERYAREARETKRSSVFAIRPHSLNTLETWVADPKTPLEREIMELGPWFHNLHIQDVQTAPDHPFGDFPRFKWEQIAPHIPEDLHGWNALDIGCNAGFYSFELARRGAQVTAIDMDEHYLRQAKWAADRLSLAQQIQFRHMQIYDLVRLNESFDLVLFMGVFYHLRYPLLALDIVASRVNRLMVFQTMTMPGDEVFVPKTDMGFHERDQLCHSGWPKMAFIEHRLAGDPTNWWAPNHAAVEAMLRSSGFHVDQKIAHEIYLCMPIKENTDSDYKPFHREMRAAVNSWMTTTHF